MYVSGHFGFSFIIYSPIIIAVGLLEPTVVFPYLTIGIVIVGAMSVFPDIDLEIDKLEHRGITHTVWFILFVMGITTIITHYIVLYSGFDYYLHLWFLISFLPTIAITSHIIIDSITPTGIHPFYPVSNIEIKKVFTIKGQKSKAKNSVWNTALFIIGIVSLFTSFSVLYFL